MRRRMTIELKKGADGPSTLACVRDDGSRTWGKVQRFFPVHDLTHCAVETLLDFDDAFFGLIAAGWAIDDFEQTGIAARLPVEAHWAENIVGLLDLERGTGRLFTGDEFNDALSLSLHGQKVIGFRAIGEDELSGIRDLRDRLARDWAAVPPGGTLSVPFPAT